MNYLSDGLSQAKVKLDYSIKISFFKLDLIELFVEKLLLFSAAADVVYLDCGI